jgi:hypothetical protein
MAPVRPLVWIVAAGAVALAVAVAVKKPGAAGAAIGAGVVDMANGVISGAIFEVGNGLGIPDTSQPVVVSQGQAELAAGNYWDASFHLPAGEFISGVWNRLTN